MNLQKTDRSDESMPGWDERDEDIDVMEAVRICNSPALLHFRLIVRRIRLVGIRDV